MSSESKDTQTAITLMFVSGNIVATNDLKNIFLGQLAK